MAVTYDELTVTYDGAPVTYEGEGAVTTTTTGGSAKPTRRRATTIGSFYTPEPRTLGGFLTMPTLTVTGTLHVREDEEWLTGIPA